MNHQAIPEPRPADEEHTAFVARESDLRIDLGQDPLTAQAWVAYEWATHKHAQAFRRWRDAERALDVARGAWALASEAIDNADAAKAEARRHLEATLAAARTQRATPQDS